MANPDETEVKPPSDPPPLSRESRFTPGSMLAGRFRIVAPLGKGGMGEVYRAEDVKLGQQVALKFLPRSLERDAAKLERLYGEVRLGRQVSHPNVCRIYDVVEWEGNHFISMEYIDGEDLASLLRRIGRLPDDKALDIARDLCAGLAAAHTMGIVHRDLKPANVMIDGKGKARITDFGLAAFTDEATRKGEIAGTPAYMAPEQLSGGEVTPRSDLYSLGVTLYEMFTGKRLIEADSLAEVIAHHQSGHSHSVSRETKGIDPAVQRVISRCLEERPDARPSSIHAVIAALPGGDPLQAAVDAGETPSPEMVAAAGETGELRPLLAWSMLIAVILLILVNAALSQRTMLYGKVPLPKRPEVLADRARGILARAGHTGQPADVAYTLGWNNDYFENEKTRKDDLTNVRPSPVVFYYRESPRPLVPLGVERRVTEIDPPLTVSGMGNVKVDPSGRLIEFAVVPPQAEDPPSSVKPIDWRPFVAETGIDAATLRTVSPRWRVPVDSDSKFAWQGEYPEQPGVPVRVEAAAHHGRPVWFSLIPPWQQADRTTFVGAPPVSRMTEFVGPIIGIFTLLGAGLLARRNLRSSRGDRKGAMRLATFLLILFFVRRFFRVDHTWSIAEEGQILFQVAAEAIIGAVAAWILYVALEPYFRRRWPRLLIGWTRLLSGRFRDPMVGRDILAGALAGCAGAILGKLAILAPTWFGRPPLPPIRTYFTALTELRHVVFLILNMTSFAIGIALLCGILFLLFNIITRSSLAATILVASVVALTSGTGSTQVQLIVECLIAAILVLLFRRYGLLSLAALVVFLFVLRQAPLTLDPSVWYFGRSMFVMVFMAVIAAFAFWHSLAAEALFKLAVLEED